MNRTQKIGVGLVVLAILGYAAYATGKKDQAKGFATKDTKKIELPEIKGTDDLDKLVIENADKGEVVLEKKGEKWEVTKPLNAPANQANVKSLLDNLKELKATEQIEASLTEEAKKTYQLEPSKAVKVVGYKGADKKVDNTFGKSGGRGQVVVAEGKPGVYIASGYSGYLYTRELKNWRDGEIFKFDDANASQLTIERNTGTFSFTKGDKWSGTFKGKPIADFDEDKVKDALRAFKALNADDFGDGKTPADTGLDAPESKVTVSLKDGAGTYVLAVGNVVDGGTSRYAQKAGDPTIYVITSYPAEWATADVAKFTKAKDKDGGAPKPSIPPLQMPGGGDFGHGGHGHPH